MVESNNAPIANAPVANAPVAAPPVCNISGWHFVGNNSVRRQSFWDRRRLKIRESLAPLICNIMRLADGADCLSFDPFPFDQNGLATSEIDVGRSELGGNAKAGKIAWRTVCRSG